MINLDIQTIARITGGRLTPAGAAGTVTGISTDSRTLKSGELFVPLRGPNFDGHDFLIRALRNGAAACLSEEVVGAFPVPLIQVPDTLVALGDLAAARRREFSGPVVGLTGSTGKTTTKDMVANILALTGPGLKTEGNFNNLVGLPLTLFRLQPDHEWVVLEMGMSARGEIARLTEIAEPFVGVVTNVGPAHLETLQNIEGVLRAKGELFASMKPGSIAVVNADDERVARLPVANGVRRLCFGLNAEAQVRAENIVATGQALEFDLLLPSGRWPVCMQVAGRHNVLNALAAAATASALEVDGERIVRGLEAFRPAPGRMEVVSVKDDILILEDSYNANPLSVKAALTTLDELGGEGRRVAVLGDMLELGNTSAELHHEIGQAAGRRVDLLVLLGQMAAEVAAGAREAGLADARIIIVGSHEEAVAQLRSQLQCGDRVLVKGSRGMKMEKISSVLRAEDVCLAAGNC
ncbi:MAG: UDP-N-acetylmuramoylalanyl-D-glutamyl-2, 6-diaminopimelate--D-alanyl-D-alanine ligase [Desulfuromonadaceae bacterium GWC2_58_13]|nr:MAG: UDP-N-acetylmuramoylalanyl-D-glutamyl-2, 6-diaminopimelate--D-alanyl-D-alanine ligase [Desulfuromonadaceae bacterium GWC2_58_13]